MRCSGRDPPHVLRGRPLDQGVARRTGRRSKAIQIAIKSHEVPDPRPPYLASSSLPCRSMMRGRLTSPVRSCTPVCQGCFYEVNGTVASRLDRSREM
jgi:hypothetical protein